MQNRKQPRAISNKYKWEEQKQSRREVVGGQRTLVQRHSIAAPVVVCAAEYYSHPSWRTNTNNKQTNQHKQQHDRERESDIEPLSRPLSPFLFLTVSLITFSMKSPLSTQGLLSLQTMLCDSVVPRFLCWQFLISERNKVKGLTKEKRGKWYSKKLLDTTSKRLRIRIEEKSNIW